MSIPTRVSTLKSRMKLPARYMSCATRARRSSGPAVGKFSTMAVMVTPETSSGSTQPMAEMNGLAILPNRQTEMAAGFELAFVTDDPHTAYATAITAGAAAIAPPAEKPWGQVVAYVRDPNGCLVEICSPIGS